MAWISNGSRSRPYSRDQRAAVAAGVHPAVAQPRRAAQRRLRVAADEDRNGPRGHGVQPDARDVVVPAAEREEAAAREPAQDLDHLVGPGTARRPVRAGQREVLRPRAQPDAEAQPVARQHRDRERGLRDQHRLSDRQLHHEGGEAQPLGDRAQRSDQRERVEERLVGEELAAAVGGIRVAAVGDLGIADAVGHHVRVPARGLRRRGERRVVGGIAHRLGVREAHAPSSSAAARTGAPAPRRPLPARSRSGDRAPA